MNIKMKSRPEKMSMKLGVEYLKCLTELAQNDESIIRLEADLLMALGPNFWMEYPDRTIDCGIQEANMVGVGTGLSATGFKPFLHTFGCFMTRRTFDQIFISAAYSKLNLKMVGSDPGITAKYNGGTHMPFEDLGIMRLIPHAMVFDCADPVQIKSITRKIADIYGIQYLRFPRSFDGYALYEEGSEFEPGKGVVLKDGSDVTIVAAGVMVGEALDAANLLGKDGISAAVIDMFTVKPIDRELLVHYAKKTRAVVTAENHNVIGGLGSAVAEVLSESCPTVIGRIGSQDKFGEVGDYAYLLKAFNMTANNIAEMAMAVIAKK